VSDADGSFAIDEVPEGTYTIKVYSGKDVVAKDAKDIVVKAPTTEVKLDGPQVS
jgi:hypothetical protein